MPSSASVLLIDDDLSFRDTLEDVLIEEGHSVKVARNGADALGLMARLPGPVLIFLDINMPVMDGIKFLSHVREWPDRDRFEIVIMTSAVSTEWFRDTRGVVKAMRKSFDAAEIVELTRNFAARHHPPRASMAGAGDQPSAFVSAASPPPAEPEE
jgi:CheY-like chemotaxis protein